MIPEKLKQRLAKLGLDERIYDQRARKCMLSREKLGMERVPWYEHAYYIPEDFSKKDAFIFDPVSLVPCLALAPQNHESILDMCAAPGTKTFILSFMTSNEATIVANDISFQRTKRLKFNVEKFGLSVNTMNVSGRKIEGSFDRILLDAPCSGEGMVNKKEKLFEHWSEKAVRFLARKQKKLITHAFDLLKPGGTLVYSTCTFEPEENEGVVDYLLRKGGAVEEIRLDIKHEKGLTSWEGRDFDKSLSKCLRIYPFHNQTGGFFAAKIEKK
jgi:NOL1/NOP2/sun family putative RNA methylase